MSKPQSPIRSRAQLDMLARAAADPAYAESRGIEPKTAQDLLDQHKTAGSPSLPERVAATATRPAARAARKLRLLGPH